MSDTPTMIYVLEEHANYLSIYVIFLTKEEAVAYATSRRDYYSSEGVAWEADLYKVPGFQDDIREDEYYYELEDGELIRTFIS